MFEVAELGMKMSKQEFADKERELHTALLKVQQQLRQSRHAAVIVISGVEGAGKGEVVNRLNTWFDSRGVETNAFWDETDEQLLRPRYWRFWRTLPAHGRIGLLFGSWYTKPIVERAFDRIDDAEYKRQLEEIVEFEQMLTDDGVVLIKLWFHLKKSKVEKQLKKDARTSHHILEKSPWTKRYAKQYDRFVDVSEVAISTTDVATAPWHVIEAGDVQYRDYTAGQLILEGLQHRLAPEAALKPAKTKAAAKPAEKTVAATAKPGRKSGLTVLDKVELDRQLDPRAYAKKLVKWQDELNRLTWLARKQKRSLVLMFEGWDAAGKGSAIRRITQCIDARLYKVISTAAPTDEEAAHHYLWRFWRHIPLAGYVSIYDRSWYGRVLVERVEKFARDDEWQRAYAEINHFERQLCESGIVLVKFWLHISREEQYKRFKQREITPWKYYKITEEDWRNRDKWDDYKLAVNDMVAHTGTTVAPWHLIPANDKKFARVEVLKTICKALQAKLDE
ncbi:MAG TPA: polyphosphate:AMP phosphotransferase [Candidatus Acidoferrum sp.]|nr:polyphosphate:AMP phosphotransferase [Candidatus Acidoferrum sp.]